MKSKKIIRRTLPVLLLAAALYFGDLFLGNPVSYAIVKRHSQSYLESTYPGLNLRVTDIYHNWYSGGGYDVSVESPTSRDTRFTLLYNRAGILEWDDYEQTVASGRSTLSRLYEEYALAVNAALTDLDLDVACMPGLSVIDEYTAQPVPLSTGIDMSRLEPDREYDVSALGAQYGYIQLSICVSPENLTAAQAAEYLLPIKAALEEKDVGFVTLDLFMTGKDSAASSESLGISGITAADLETEDPAARLEQMCLQQLDSWNSPKEE